MLSIVELEIKKVQERVKSKGMELVLSQEAKQFLVDKGFDEKFGARPLKRTIENYVEDCLVDGILEQKIKENQKVTLSLDKESKTLKYVTKLLKPASKIKQIAKVK